jgi:4-alpha-glucanotransferase
MRFERSSGVLLHVTSLPGEYGIGDLGPAAYEFVDQLAAAGQRYWQILPVSPTGYGDSPYQSFSAFAGNVLLISPERLVDDGLIGADIFDDAPRSGSGRVDYGAVYSWKTGVLPRVYERFTEDAGDTLRKEFK